MINDPILKNYPYNASSYLKYPWPNSGPLLATIQWLLPTLTLSRKIYLFTYIFNTQQTNIGNAYKGGISWKGQGLSLKYRPIIRIWNTL